MNPDYYNAWVKLAALIQRVPIPGNDIEESTRALLRLDPARIRSSRFADSRDLGVVWDAILAGEKAREALSSGPYFPLPASQAELDKMKDIKDPFGGRNIRRTKSSAREEFARHPLIESVSEMMSALRARS